MVIDDGSSHFSGTIAQSLVVVENDLNQRVMAHSFCTGPGIRMEPGLGPGMMGLHIMPLTIHTTQEQGQGTGLGTNGLHTHFPVRVQ